MTCQTCGWYPLLPRLFNPAFFCTGCFQTESDCYCEDAEGGDDD